MRNCYVLGTSKFVRRAPSFRLSGYKIRSLQGSNPQPLSRFLAGFVIGRSSVRVEAAIQKEISTGDEPATVAKVIYRALTDEPPRLRYPVGNGATFHRGCSTSNFENDFNSTKLRKRNKTRRHL